MVPTPERHAWCPSWKAGDFHRIPTVVHTCLTRGQPTTQQPDGASFAATHREVAFYRHLYQKHTPRVPSARTCCDWAHLLG
eukprot:3649954-Pleurochrysis_carterae.AAC.1